MLADDTCLFMRECTSTEKNGKLKQNYIPCSFVMACWHTVGVFFWGGARSNSPMIWKPDWPEPTVWDRPQPECSGRPGTAVPTRSTRGQHPTAAALHRACAPGRTNVLFSLRSFLILLLTVWQDYLILLGWPFRDFVLNPFFFFFKLPLICCVGKRIQLTPQNGGPRWYDQLTAVVKTSG